MTEPTGTSGDSLKIEYDDTTGQMIVDWNDNDPMWGFLSCMNEDQIKDFITTAIQNALDSADDIIEDEI
jgi:hypothetical protein